MSKDNATEDLRAEPKSFTDTLGEILSSSGDKSREEMNKTRSKAEHMLRESRHRLNETNNVIAKQTREAAAKTGNYVHENLRTGVDIGAAVGVMLGVLLSCH